VVDAVVATRITRRYAVAVNRSIGGWAAELPGDQGARRRLSDWLREKLYQRRIVLVTGYLDDAVANETAAALLSLDAVSDAPIDLYLDSPGGTLEAAFTLIDVLDALAPVVGVHCRGQVGGPAIGVVAAVDRRAAAPHTRFRLEQPTSQFSGTPEQIRTQSQQQQALLWRWYARLAQVTGRPAEEIAEDVRRGRSLDAREALEYGLIDEISAAR
jgi:ATP-dependent Clp protease protease subunit